MLINGDGYYIGRYEAGRTNESSTETKIKQNLIPYSNIKWSTTYNLAKNVDNGLSAHTFLCSSYAWDTAINFIQKNGVKADGITKATDYGSGHTGYNANYRDATVTYIENGTKKTKEPNVSLRLNTGLTTPVCNIYDMAGNVAEFTTEINPNTTEACVIRGGIYDYINTTFSAGRRWDDATNYSAETYGFRVTLFLNVD